MHELEQRTFISKDIYNKVNEFLEQEHCLVESKKQILYKYRGNYDFRVTVEKNQTILRMRKGNQDEDIFVTITKEDTENFLEMLHMLGHILETKWYRTRKIYRYQDFDITLDKTFRYGYVISVSTKVSLDKIKEGTERLYAFFQQFQIGITSAEQFYDQYHHYLTNWYEYTKDIDDRTFF